MDVLCCIYDWKPGEPYISYNIPLAPISTHNNFWACENMSMNNPTNVWLFTSYNHFDDVISLLHIIIIIVVYL